jgi:hypothetical protein
VEVPGDGSAIGCAQLSAEDGNDQATHDWAVVKMRSRLRLLVKLQNTYKEN